MNQPAPETETTNWAVVTDGRNTSMPYFHARVVNGQWEFRKASSGGVVRYRHEWKAQKAADRLNGLR